jgi:cell cycle related kinase
MGYIFVFEYMLSDLSEVIRNVNQPLTNSQIKSYMRMLLNGVSFCHENRIMHRVKFIQNKNSLFYLFHRI